MRNPNKIPVEVELTPKAHRKLKAMAASHQPKTTLRQYVAHILEQHAKKNP